MYTLSFDTARVENCVARAVFHLDVVRACLDHKLTERSKINACTKLFKRAYASFKRECDASGLDETLFRQRVELALDAYRKRQIEIAARHKAERKALALDAM